LTAAAACGGFAAERRTGRRYLSRAADAGRPAATAPQHGAAARRSAANAGSVMLTAKLTRLQNTDKVADDLKFHTCYKVDAIPVH